MKRPTLRTGFAALVLAGFASLAAPAMAAPITLDGITFAEASDNFNLLAVTGSGRLDDPFVVVEEVLRSGETVLSVNIHSVEFGSRVATFHMIGFALTKVVINRTDHVWNFFNIELEQSLGIGSDYYDGLSFGQDALVNRPFVSNRFGRVEDIQEPRDAVRFYEGAVPPGDTVVFKLAITHTGPTPKFFLVQHVKRPLSERRGHERRWSALHEAH